MVPGPMVDGVWDQVSANIAEALRYDSGRFDLEDVREAIRAERAQLWLAFRNAGWIATVVTEVQRYPQKSVLRFWCLEGSGVKENLALERVFEPFARRCDCDQLEIIGRAGWERILRPMGYRRQSTVLVRDLEAQG